MKELRVLLRTLKKSETVSRTPRQPKQSVRDYPTYTIPEAALYLAIPENTLRYWITSHPLWLVSHVGKSVPILSFHDIAQAYFIDVLRRHYYLSVADTRRILKAARIESTAKYPLLKENIRVFYKHVIMDKKARGRLPRRMIDLSRHPQLVIPEVVEPLSTRIRWDDKGNLVQIYPWRNWSGKAEDKSRPVTIHPDVMSGRLVITGTRIPVEVVAQRTSKGEKIPSIAKDYKLSEDSIEQALRHLVPQAA
jgi:uncharacterized protein (DUF433 family)/DNA-binding transcriptional MerR regulator